MQSHRFGVHAAFVFVVSTASMPVLTAQIGGPLLDGRRNIGGDDYIPPTGKMTRFQHGDLTGDHMTDGVLRIGARSFAVYAPGLHHAMQAFPGQDIDAVVLPKGAQDGSGRDGLVRSTAQGIEVCWVVDDPEGFTTASIGSSQWAGVVRLQCGDMNGDGAPDIAGLTPDRMAIVMMTDPLDPGTEQLIPFENPIDEFDLIEWNDDPSSCEIVAFSGGLGVFDQTGAKTYGYTTGGPGDSFVVVRQPQIGFDRIAACMRLGGAHSLFGMDQGSFDTVTFMGQLDINGAKCADFDLDGEPDYLLAHKALGKLVYFQSQLVDGTGPGAYGWLENGWDLIDATADERGNQAIPESEASPLFVDIDRDDDADIVMPDQLLRELVVLRSGARAHRAGCAKIARGALVIDDDAGTETLEIRLEPPPEPPDENDAIEVWVWTQPDPDSHTNPISIFRGCFQPLTWPMDIEVEIDQPELVSEQLTHVVYRLVDVAEPGSDEVVSAGPVYNLAFSTWGPSLQWLADEYDINLEEDGNFIRFDVRDADEPDGGGAGGGGGGGVGGGGPNDGFGQANTNYSVDDLAPNGSGEVGAAGVPSPCTPCQPPDIRPR